jgi:hypothetical protein
LASEIITKAEMTDAERFELKSKVFVKLKKRRRLFRFFKIGKAVLLCAFLISCGTAAKNVQSPKDESPAFQIKKGLSVEHVPSEFEKEMPESSVTLSSIVKFSKEPSIREISSDVVDFDFNNGFLAMLKKGRVETNMIDCRSILLDGKFFSIKTENGLGLITGSEKAVVVDFKRCGILHEMESKGKGFSISKDYFLEFSRNSYTFYNARKIRKIFEGSFLGNVVYGHLSGSKALFANENGKVALMSAESGKFAAIFSERFDIKSLYFNEMYAYVYDTDNKLYRLRPDYKTGELVENGDAQGKDGCFFLKRSGYLLCDKYIFGVDAAYESPMTGEKGLFVDGLLFIQKDGTLFMIDMDKKYKKSLKLGVMKDRLCLKEGKAYFYDFDGSTKYISASGNENTVDEYPKECDHRFSFNEGALKTPAGKEIYRFADVVNSSENALMLKRVIGDTIYYYFEKK